MGTGPGDHALVEVPEADRPDGAGPPANKHEGANPDYEEGNFERELEKAVSKGSAARSCLPATGSLYLARPR